MALKLQTIFHSLPGLLLAVASGPSEVRAAEQPTVRLPEFVSTSARVANLEPVGAFAMPVSALRFEPLVDVQSRNLAEGQADVIIRGGIFENTGFRVGGVTLLDPQTGHYFAEIPVAPAMLTAPVILTGAANALGGFNSTVGTIAYDWRPIESRGEVSAAFGEHGLNRQALYAGAVGGQTWGGRTVAVDFDAARSEADGAVAGGDHRFNRLSGRVQLRDASTQTDLFYGYQSKFFGWPNLYTPYNVLETENLQTNLGMLTHRMEIAGGGEIRAAGYVRRNKDDYEFNRLVPGIYNPYQHESRSWGAALEGRFAFDGWTLNARGETAWDEIESSSLVFGRFNSRHYRKLSLAPERVWSWGPDQHLTARAGLVFDDTDREDSALLPIVSLTWDQFAGDSEARRYYIELADSSQVPGYTALNSNAAGGLFRGNPELGREESRNLEAGLMISRQSWRWQGALFHRADDDLADWTYVAGVNARRANPVDMETWGLETVFARAWNSAELLLGYTYLEKEADYGGAVVDASFYALNYARHRLTAALIVRLPGGWEVRADTEARIQKENPLRRSDRQAVVTSLGLYYFPRAVPGLELTLLADNLWDSDFEEVPSVPAAGRQLSLGAVYRW